jgi:PAS domain S-box-containing protein
MVAERCASRGSWHECVDGALVGGIGYTVLATTTIFLTSDGRNHATMWPADAIILALLLKHPKQHWPYILLAGWFGNLAANTLTRDWMPGLILYGGINMAQTWLAAWLISRADRPENVLADAGTTFRFILSAGVVAPVFGATLGSLVTEGNYGEAFVSSFVRWYLSNALGFLILAPFMQAVLDGSYARSFKEKLPIEKLETIGLHGFHGLLTCFVFVQDKLPLLFLPISSLLLLAFRLGRSGAMVGVMTIALIGATAMFRDHGPVTLMRYPPDVEEFYFQFYLAVLLATALPVAAIVSSRKEAQQLLAEREEALRLVMAHSPDCMVSFDLAGICRWADGPLEKYLGLVPADILGRSVDVVSPLAHDIASEMRITTKAGRAHRGTFEFSPMLRPDIILEGSIGLLKRKGRDAGAVVTLRDITARKASEDNRLSSGPSQIIQWPAVRKSQSE